MTRTDVTSHVLLVAVLGYTVALSVSCSECDPNPCRNHVAIDYEGTGPDRGLMRIRPPYTVTLEIRDSDGQQARDTLVYEVSSDIDRVALGRIVDSTPFGLSLGQPRDRDALAETVFVEVDSADWYGTGTFEMNYFETSACCQISTHTLYFQPRRDLP